MPTCTLRTLLLCTILINTPFLHGIDNNIPKIIGGGLLIAIVSGGIGFGISAYTSKHKYTHLENEALRKQEAQAKQDAEQKQRIDDQEQKALTKARDMIERFSKLYEEYKHLHPAELKRNPDFQEKLTVLITGKSSDPERGASFDALINDTIDNLFNITTATLKPETDSMRPILIWMREQANISPQLAAEDTRRADEDRRKNNERLKSETEEINVKIKAERLHQEQLITAVTSKTCQNLEEMYEKHAHITHILEKTAAELPRLIRQNLANIERLVINIGENLQKANREGVERLSAERATQHNELREISANTIAHASRLSVHTSKEIISKAASQEQQLQTIQKELVNLKNQTPDPIKLEKFIAATIYESEQRQEKSTADAMSTLEKRLEAKIVAQQSKSPAQNTTFAHPSKAFTVDRGPEFETE